jgi:hypothetical protein
MMHEPDGLEEMRDDDFARKEAVANPSDGPGIENTDIDADEERDGEVDADGASAIADRDA